MAAGGVELAFDMTRHSVIGLWEAVRGYRRFRRLFHRLLELACERQPDVIICIDFGGFNLRFARAIKQLSSRSDWFHDWHPRVVQFVSPQIWASRPARAYEIAHDYDLVAKVL